MCFLASGDTVSIVPTFRQFCACLSDGNGASFGIIARYGVSFGCRYMSYIFAACLVRYAALPASLVEATPCVLGGSSDGSRAVILSTWNSFVLLDTSEK